MDLIERRRAQARRRIMALDSRPLKPVDVHTVDDDDAEGPGVMVIVTLDGPEDPEGCWDIDDYRQVMRGARDISNRWLGAEGRVRVVSGLYTGDDSSAPAYSGGGPAARDRGL